MGGEEYVLVLGECSGISISDEPLRKNTDDHGRVDTGVDSDAHIAAVLHDDVRMDILEAELGELSMQKVNRNGKQTSDAECRGDKVIRLARGEHLLGDGAVGDGVTVV